MVYADPVITNISLGPWLTGIDTATEGWFGLFLLIAIYVIVFLAGFFGRTTPAKAATVAGFVSAIIGLMLIKIGLISQMEILIIVIFIAIGLIGIYVEGKQGY